MVDAMQPFASTFEDAVGRGDSVDVAWEAACEAAERSADATASMVARVGRARPHGERSVGTPDPGARSFVVVVRAALPALAKDAPSSRRTGSESHRA
jgi:dihydroxyacetone kinase